MSAGNCVYIPNEQQFTNVKQINYNELVYGIMRDGNDISKNSVCKRKQDKHSYMHNNNKILVWLKWRPKKFK